MLSVDSRTITPLSFYRGYVLRPETIQASHNGSIEAYLLVCLRLDDHLLWSEIVYQHGPSTAVPVLLGRVVVI